MGYFWKHPYLGAMKPFSGKVRKIPIGKVFRWLTPLIPWPPQGGPKKQWNYEISPQWNPFSLIDFRPWKTPGLIYYVYSFYNYMLYVYSRGPKFPIFFVWARLLLSLESLKGHDYFLGTSPPGVAFEGPEGAIRFPIQAALLAPHMGHLNFSLKNAPSRPLAEEDNGKRVGKAVGSPPGERKKQRKRWMTGWPHHVSVVSHGFLFNKLLGWESLKAPAHVNWENVSYISTWKQIRCLENSTLRISWWRGLTRFFWSCNPQVTWDPIIP